MYLCCKIIKKLHHQKEIIIQLTFVATANMATPWRMGCQAPMSWAFSGTLRRNWVVIFQASTRISNRLFNRARTGARGKDATKRVTKPNWITVRNNRHYLDQAGRAPCSHHSEPTLYASYPFRDIHKRDQVLKRAEAESLAPSEVGPHSLRSDG